MYSKIAVVYALATKEALRPRNDYVVLPGNWETFSIIKAGKPNFDAGSHQTLLIRICSVNY